MSDKLVAAALRSDAPLVFVEAPAGFGKTYQAAQYAKDLLAASPEGRLLILTHTNAACDVFADRARHFGSRVEIRTIDNLIVSIASVYHQALGLPGDVAAWAYKQGKTGFDQIANKIAKLLENAPVITQALAVRYPVMICDEHQDSSDAQDRVVSAIRAAGVRARIFGDSMQSIYASKKNERETWQRRWDALKGAAKCVELDTPHRWKQQQADELGDWVKSARIALRDNGQVDLRGKMPKGLSIIRADNTARMHGQYILSADGRRPIDKYTNGAANVLVLAAQNETVQGLRSFFNRRIPIWEGATREPLSALAVACDEKKGDAGALASAFVDFVQGVTIGFTNGDFGQLLKEEAVAGCTSRRSKRPAKVQSLARLIVEKPDVRGLGEAAASLGRLIADDPDFRDVHVDLQREFAEAGRLAQYADAAEGLKEITRRRTKIRPRIPSKALSTVHKAKGLEFPSVIVVACDKSHFGDDAAKRCLMYVAMSRATKSLALVVPNNEPSPLFRV